MLWKSVGATTTKGGPPLEVSPLSSSVVAQVVLSPEKDERAQSIFSSTLSVLEDRGEAERVWEDMKSFSMLRAELKMGL